MPHDAYKAACGLSTTEMGLALEAMVDQHGLYIVAGMLAEVCALKAEHLAINWQDRPATLRWTKAQRVFDRAVGALMRIQGGRW